MAVPTTAIADNLVLSPREVAQPKALAVRRDTRLDPERPVESLSRQLRSRTTC